VKLRATSLPFGRGAAGRTKARAVMLSNFGTSPIYFVFPGMVMSGAAAANYS
jgi:hypothetical protein